MNRTVQAACTFSSGASQKQQARLLDCSGWRPPDPYRCLSGEEGVRRQCLIQELLGPSLRLSHDGPAESGAASRRCRNRLRFPAVKTLEPGLDNRTVLGFQSDRDRGRTTRQESHCRANEQDASCGIARRPVAKLRVHESELRQLQTTRPKETRRQPSVCNWSVRICSCFCQPRP